MAHSRVMKTQQLNFYGDHTLIKTYYMNYIPFQPSLFCFMPQHCTHCTLNLDTSVFGYTQDQSDV